MAAQRSHDNGLEVMALLHAGEILCSDDGGLGVLPSLSLTMLSARPQCLQHHLRRWCSVRWLRLTVSPAPHTRSGWHWILCTTG